MALVNIRAETRTLLALFWDPEDVCSTFYENSQTIWRNITDTSTLFKLYIIWTDSASVNLEQYSNTYLILFVFPTLEYMFLSTGVTFCQSHRSQRLSVCSEHVK